MAKLKITLTGVPEKEPKRHANGNVDLIFKVEPTTAVPKGLEPLKECVCLVHVAPKTWKKVEGNVQPESKVLVQGEVTPRVNTGGKLFLEVVALDIGLIEKKESQAAGEKQSVAVAPSPKKPKPRGIGTPKGTKDIVDLSYIQLPEGLVAPGAERIQEVMAYVEARNTFDKPLILEEKTNVLLEGYEYYLAAVEMNIGRVPIAYPPKEVPKPAGQPRGKKPERPVPPRESWRLVPITAIQIPEKYLVTPPNPQKVQEVVAYIQAKSQFDKPLFITTSNRLVDGYKRYMAAVELHIEQVPVVIDVKTSFPAKEQGESSGM